jgi:hypothetical protein
MGWLAIATWFDATAIYGSASAGPQKAPGKKPGDKNLCSLTNWGYKYFKHLAFLTSQEKTQRNSYSQPET